MRFTEKDKCGAWRCDSFSCDTYSDYDYDCQQGHCHVCAAGQMCINCQNYEDCPEAADNMELQKARHGTRKRNGA